jgi:hypothetical protein
MRDADQSLSTPEGDYANGGHGEGARRALGAVCAGTSPTSSGGAYWFKIGEGREARRRILFDAGELKQERRYRHRVR